MKIVLRNHEHYENRVNCKRSWQLIEFGGSRISIGNLCRKFTSKENQTKIDAILYLISINYENRIVYAGQSAIVYRIASTNRQPLLFNNDFRKLLDAI